MPISILLWQGAQDQGKASIRRTVLHILNSATKDKELVQRVAKSEKKQMTLSYRELTESVVLHLCRPA
jgi:hypothetical protein